MLRLRAARESEEGLLNRMMLNTSFQGETASGPIPKKCQEEEIRAKRKHLLSKDTR